MLTTVGSVIGRIASTVAKTAGFTCIALLLAATAAPCSAEASIERAKELFEGRDYAAARLEFEAVLGAQGDNHEALSYLGRIALAEEDLDAAVDALKRAVELDDSNSAYHTWLGRAYIMKLQTVSFFEKGILAGRAQDHLNKAVRLDPTNTEARIYLAQYYLNAPSIAGGSKKKAREQAEEILKYDPVEGKALLAGICVKDEEYDLAIEKYISCIEARPEDSGYRYELAMLYQQLEDYEECFAVFEDLLEIDPGAPAALYQIGRTAVFSKTNLDRGMECLREYLEADPKPGYPGHDAAHWRLGMLYEHKGNQDKARAEYEKALEINPEGEEYRKSLASLDGK